MIRSQVLVCGGTGCTSSGSQKIQAAFNAELKKQGIAILMVSEEMMELIGMADRIITMKDGCQHEEFIRSKDLTESVIIKSII